LSFNFVSIASVIAGSKKIFDRPAKHFNRGRGGLKNEIRRSELRRRELRASGEFRTAGDRMNGNAATTAVFDRVLSVFVLVSYNSRILRAPAAGEQFGLHRFRDPHTQTMQNYRRLLRFLRPYLWPHFAVAVVCMITYSATNGALPFLTKSIFDDVFAGRNEAFLTWLPGVIIGVFAVRGLVSYGEHYLMSYINGHIINDIRNALHGHILSLSISFFHRNPTGTLISRLTNDVGLVSRVLTEGGVSLLRDSVSLVVLTGAAIFMDPLLGLIAFVVFPISVFPMMKLGQKMRGVTKRGQVTVGQLTSLMQEAIQGIRIVKAFGMEQYERNRFFKENRRLLRQGIRKGRIRAITTPAMELLAAFAIGGVVWYGGYSVIEGNRTQGQFMAFMAAMFLMYQPFKKLAGTNTLLQQGVVAAERLYEILDLKSDIQDKPAAVSAPLLARAIEFHDVSFGYGDKLVLKHINLRINKGEMIALVGISGVGKSTLADLIPRFYDVSSGKITVDGIDIRDVTLESLQSQIGVVTQHTFLFNDTIKNNIAYGNTAQDMAHIVAAAKAASAHDFIMALPKGYNSVIGELGMRLSGGERQRIAIARALLKDPPILILDEATSSLDSHSEKAVQEALERLMVGRTVLVIAHRLSTIRKASRIILLNEGTITEQGTHDELLAKKAEYNKLYTLQLLEGDDGPRKRLLH
jgi:subfamily B ATP-binding cassette protein MsbA